MAARTPRQDSQPAWLTRRSFVGLGALAGLASLAEAKHAGSGPGRWDRVTDVLVVGGGAAGCVAAATARAAGADVMLCEKAGFLGGTSAKSGGVYWIPNNFDLRRRGIADPRPDWLRFVARYSFPAQYDPAAATLGVPDDVYRLLEAFYDHAASMVDVLSTIGALQSTALVRYAPNGVDYFPDYLEHAEENRAPRGRCLVPRRTDGSGGYGDDLMEQLTTHVHRAGVGVLLEAPVVDLIANDGRVQGAVLRAEGGELRVRARRGVVFCSGGYSQNRALVEAFQPHPIMGRCGLPTCTGDFVRLGAAAGARLGNMTGAWRAQCVLEQALQYPSLPNEVWYPVGDSMFVVNKYGRRCFNENRNYHDRTRESYFFDANRAEYPNLLTFPIYDRRSAERYAGNFPLPDVPLGEPYVISGATLEELAAALDERLAAVSAHTGGVRLDDSFLGALRATTARYNEHARSGRDPDFLRGHYPFDAEWQSVQVPRAGTPWRANPYPNPVMHPLSDTGPYYTMILAPAVLDTNGGPVIDPTGAVIAEDGRPIPGLYGAGNCIASPAGNTYWAAGATLGSAMTFAYLAGRSAALSASA